MSETRTLLCGICHMPVNERTDAQGNPTVICTTCGANDSLESAVREASEYVVDKLMREGLPEVRSGPVTVTHSPKRSFRFIVGD